MDKVKLTQKQADVLETMKAKGAPLNEIVARHIDHDYLQVNDYEEVSGLSTDTIIRALYIGYEVEQTPGDKVREMWGIAGVAERNAIRSTLNALDIKVKGVND